MRDEVVAALTGDATLMALLTGGAYGGVEISRQFTPLAFDANNEVLPCALVKVESDAHVWPYWTGSRVFVLVLFYQRYGYAVIDPAMGRVYTLLNMTKVGGSGVWNMVHANDVRDLRDQALDCSMAMSRYVATRMR